jgi:hypothetical protein
MADKQIIVPIPTWETNSDPLPTWETYLGFWSPRGSASVSTLMRRAVYGGRKARRAHKRLHILAMKVRWNVGVSALGHEGICERSVKILKA